MNIYIDSENVSPKSFNKLLDKLNSWEVIFIKIFCDFGDDNSNSWYKFCKKHINNVKIEQIQCMKKPKLGTVDNMIQAEVFDDVLCDYKNEKKILKKLVIFSNDNDYNPLVKKITKHGYDIILQKDEFSESDVKDKEKVKKKKRKLVNIEHIVQSDIKSNETLLEIKRIKERVNKLKNKFEKSKITLQDYFSAINQLLIENKKNIKSEDLNEIELLKQKLKDTLKRRHKIFEN